MLLQPMLRRDALEHRPQRSYASLCWWALWGLAFEEEPCGLHALADQAAQVAPQVQLHLIDPLPLEAAQRRRHLRLGQTAQKAVNGSETRLVCSFDRLIAALACTTPVALLPPTNVQ
jgi:hypothetical protein